MALLSRIAITRKIRRRRLGFVADFCPDCGEVQPMRLYRRLNMDHLWGIPTGLGVKLNESVICEDCGCEIETQRADYTSLSRSGAASAAIDRLIDETHPDLFEHRASLINEIEAVRSPVAAAEVRVRHVVQILLRSGQELNQRVIQVRMDRWSGLAGLGVLLPIIIGIARANGWVPRGPAWVGAALLYSGLVSLAILLMLLATDVPRYMNREVYPRLVRLLRPLNLTPDEVERAANSLRGSSHAIARKLDVRKLCRLLKT